MPIFTFIDLLFLFINLSFPIFGTFVGEIGFLVVSWRGNIFLTICLLSYQVLGAAQITWYVHRMIFAGTPLNFNLKNKIIKFIDLNFREWLILLWLALLTFLPGIRADLFISILDIDYLTPIII